MANIRHSRLPHHSGESRNPVQIERGTRTLQRPADRPSPKRSAKRTLVMLDSCFRRNGGVGFIRWMPAGFLHSLFRRNGGVCHASEKLFRATLER